MRGNIILEVKQIVLHWSIPAHAGETWPASWHSSPTRVYPCPCGGNVTQEVVTVELGVYPHSCGGNAACARPNATTWGLSPPVRGKLAEALGVDIRTGSIPARAGETLAELLRRSPLRVYPRPCGGNVVPRQLVAEHCGLSPPVRGKHRGQQRRRGVRGSIPARAGETCYGLGAGRFEMVYPRPCGGNLGVLADRVYSRGLSPPVRGKLVTAWVRVVLRWSIPARAGETFRRRDCPLKKRVYPRPCGGNYASGVWFVLAMGLSPPVRGKPLHISPLKLG